MSIAEAITPSGRYIEKITRSENEGFETPANTGRHLSEVT
jgi:hypothetical protein